MYENILFVGGPKGLRRMTPESPSDKLNSFSLAAINAEIRGSHWSCLRATEAIRVLVLTGAVRCGFGAGRILAIVPWRQGRRQSIW